MKRAVGVPDASSARIVASSTPAAAEATQEAVMDALAAAETTTGRHGHTRRGLGEIMGRPA